MLLDAVRSLENCATNDRINLPLTLGRDFSGEVVARGSNVKHVQVGDKVYGVIVPHHQGCQAEYAVVDSDLV